jgi:hypothetical protein
MSILGYYFMCQDFPSHVYRLRNSKVRCGHYSKDSRDVWAEVSEKVWLINSQGLLKPMGPVRKCEPRVVEGG